MWKIFQCFTYRNRWNNWKNWSSRTQNFSSLQAFQHLSHKWEVKIFLNSSKKFIEFLSECPVNLLHGSLQMLKKEKVVRYRKPLPALFLVRTTWKEWRKILAFGKGLLLLHLLSPFISNHLSRQGTVCSWTRFYSQQQKEDNCFNKNRTNQLLGWKTSRVPGWVVEERHQPETFR